MAWKISRWLFASTVLLVSVQCQKKVETEFLIAKDRVGNLSRMSRVQDINTLFARDSVVTDSSSVRLGNGGGRVRIYEKGGAPLLTLVPARDSLGHIENIHILDPRFMTTEGVGLHSTFKDIRTHYDIRKIITSRNNVVIFLKGQDFYVTIDREELPASLRYTANLSIEEVQIPDQAKIKYLMVGWDR